MFNDVISPTTSERTEWTPLAASPSASELCSEADDGYALLSGDEVFEEHIKLGSCVELEPRTAAGGPT